MNIQKFRPKLRGKLAFGTAIFTGIFIFFLLFFFHQISQDSLKQANMQQADSIFDSVRSSFENYLTIEKSLEKSEQKATLIRKSDLSSAIKSRKINKIEDQLKELKKNLAKKHLDIQGLFKTRPDDYQVTFISRDFTLLSHSHPEHLVRSKIGQKLPRSTIKAKRYRFHRKILKSYKKKSGKAYQPITERQVMINYQRGFLSVILPVFSNREYSQTFNLIHHLFDSSEKTHKFNKYFKNQQESNQFRNDFNELSANFELIFQQLKKFEKDWVYKQHQENKNKEIIFNTNVFLRDKEMRPIWKKLKSLHRLRLKQWRILRKSILKYYKTTLKNLKQKKQFLKGNPSDIEQLVVASLELKRVENHFKLLLKSLKTFPTIYAKVFASNEKGWERQQAQFIGVMRDPSTNVKFLLDDFFGGIVEVRILLDQKIKKSSALTFNLIDVGVSFFLRSLFLVFLLSSFFVRDIKSLAITARKVEGGNLEAKFKVESKDELYELAHTFNQMLAGLKEKEALRLEIETASVIQRNLLPQELDSSLAQYDVAFVYRAMTGVGGDYIDFFAVNENLSCLVVADVSNHGVGPGLVMTMMRSSLRTMAKQNTNLIDLVRRLNSSLYEDTPAEIFVSVFVAYIDNRSKQIEYVSCGHNHPYVVSAKEVKKLPAGGMALGAMIPVIFDPSVKAHSYKLQKGQFLYQYTDGLTEAFNAQKEQLGEERLERLLEKLGKSDKNSAQKTINNSIALLESFTKLKLPSDGPTDLTDDVAIICLGFK